MMSILTNSSAMSALQTLRSIDDQLATSQNSIASGLRINSAADNASYWSIATTMRSDNSALSAVGDALGLGAAKVETAYNGLNAAIGIVSDISSKLVAAQEPGADKDKIQKEIAQLQNQLTTISRSSSFSGENWLFNSSAAAPGTKSMVGSFVRDASGNIQVQTIDYDTSASVLMDSRNASRGLLTKAVTVNAPTGTTTSASTYFLMNISSTTPVASGTQIAISSQTTSFQLAGMTMAVDTMLKNMTDAAATLGATSSRIGSQTDFLRNLQDTITKGISRLVDADMNEESTRLKALQTQQQLGIQALSIANNRAQNIMQLFRS